MHEDGTSCFFTGRPADVGVHRYYVHGMCNPIKAVVLTNECPGCNTMLASIRSAKEHANRSWKNGCCTDHKVSRPYSYAIDAIPYPGSFTCLLCKEELEGEDAIKAHMQDHFRVLLMDHKVSPQVGGAGVAGETGGDLTGEVSADVVVGGSTASSAGRASRRRRGQADDKQRKMTDFFARGVT